MYISIFGYPLYHIKTNNMQFNEFYEMMQCPPNGPLYPATGDIYTYTYTHIHIYIYI